MKILNYQDEADRKKTNDLLTRRGFEFSTDIREKVIKIIDNVKKRGDKALFEYTSNFDDIQLNSLKLKKNKLQKSKNIVDEEFLTFLKRAEKNIKDFHQRQKEESWFSQNIGSINGQLINPLERIGAYVPGGSAAYPSSVLMTVIPAQIAGVEEIVVVTPPDNNGEVNPYTLAALDLLGIKEVYTVGGAQAVAALAYGTESILSVDKIVGPGNIYVTMAKKEVYGKVDIDMLAGPSEVLIITDDSTEPSYIASDLLSQAEHDPRAVSVLISTDLRLLNEVQEELNLQIKNLPREDIAAKSLNNKGLMIKVDNIDSAFKLANQFAPEHLELLVKEPFSYLGKVKNAGAVFLGKNSPESLGDYMAGPNHVLPTGGTARYASPLSVSDFCKKTSIIYSNKNELKKNRPAINKIARLEGLYGHAEAVNIRFSN